MGPKPSKFVASIRLRLALVGFAAMAASACAQVSHGTRQSIRVESDPPGARFTVDSDPVPYTTPTIIDFTRKEEHALVFRNDGFEDETVQLTHSTSGAVLGNVLVGGIIGAATDYSSGAAYELGHADMVNDILTIHLRPRPSATLPAPAQGHAGEGAATGGASPAAGSPARGLQE